jgi:formamidopyrimidine-DNA glycosylase
MPELPEVETTRRILEPHILGQTILTIEHTDPLRYQDTERAEGKKILSTSRRGKYMLWQLEDNLEAIIHLGMTGGFRFAEHSHTRVTLKLPKQSVYYADPRRFGKWWVVDAGDYKHINLLNRMGPEPLADTFNLNDFKHRLSQSKRKIKEVLLGQEAVAGVGNIYADESLWMSKIHPERSADSLKSVEVKGLLESIKEVMQRAVDAGGSTLSDQSYQQPSGEPGYFQFEHHVYDKEGTKCKRKGCKGVIQKIVVGGRGTHFCPLCQKTVKL